MKRSAINIFTSIFSEKCPNCGVGKVFEKKKRLFFDFPEMKEHCEHCGYQFEREPGYFLGAMYVSYALAVAEGMGAFLISTLLFNVPTLAAAFIIVGTILLFSVRNYRLARMVWLYIFPQ
jgi:uncharacterized protein (DUF983 family)